MDAKPPLTDWWLLCIVFVSLWDYEVMTYFRHAIFVDDSISHVNNERMGIRRLTFAWRDLPGSLLSCISLPPCPPKRRRECCTVQRQPVVYNSAKLHMIKHIKPESVFHQPEVNGLGRYSLSGMKSYRKITLRLETARFRFRLFQSLKNLTDVSEATQRIS